MSVRAEILRFLRDPEDFARSASDAGAWLAGLEGFALPSIERTRDRILRPAQETAWRGLADRRVGLVLGPPGTGKTHLLSWLIVGHAAGRSQTGLPARTFVSAFTRNAIGNVLDAVAKRQSLHSPGAPKPIYFGSPPAAGLSSGVDVMGPGDEADLIQAIGGGEAVVGATIWSLYRLLSSGIAPGADGPTAPLFELVCIDEASQMVLGHGLMALGGMAPGARVVVSGDDQQLPPVRAARETRVEGRDMGGSLYAFLKSARAPEFPLEETFRLNAPLAAFPERKFYPGRYVSAAPAERLALRPDWPEGLDLVARAAMNPDLPVVVLLHDGPPASTASPFEAALAARLAAALAERVVGPAGAVVPPTLFWAETAAVVSPHRAQNAAIRNALPDALRADAFVETVDRIQGKERDAVILSYCVSDPEFALAETEFIFSPERLNVASTRARTKLVLIVSRRLLEAIPAEQEVMDKAEILREFVFSCAPLAETELDGPSGRRIPVQIRTRGFDGEAVDVDLTDEPPEQAALPEMTAELEGVLAAIRRVAAEGEFGSAALYRVKQALARSAEPYAEARALHLLGWVSLKERSGRFGPFWTARPFEAARRVHGIDTDTVRARIAVAVRDAKNGRHAFYDEVRDRFAWMTPQGGDALLPVLQLLEQEGVVSFGMAGAHITLSIDAPPAEALQEEAEAAPDLLDEDFLLLNRLEDMEAARINFGVFDSWTSTVELSRKAGVDSNATVRSLSRLEGAGHVMLAEDARVRSRVAEIARELRHVKQRFRSDDADRRPFLVRSLKVELRDRRKPRRELPLAEVLDRAAAEGTPAQAKALFGVAEALGRMWGGEAALAAFQQRGLHSILAAWRGDGTPSIAVAADTGSGKTEAAALPLITGALADRMEGVNGVRAVLAYPRIRLAANQAQRLAGYLAACAGVEGLPLLTLGLQVKDVPDDFAAMHARYAENWPQAGPNAFSFPFFGCPSCGAPLTLRPGEGEEGADSLVCSRGDWRFAGWIGSKAQLQARPPALFLPTADSLHQWMHDYRYGRLFGDDPDFAPPRALLADEIHLYTHIHGAQVGLALRRLVARAELNARDSRPMVAIGMSATIGDPAEAWGRLIGREAVSVIRPEPGETDDNPRGREYFYFVQPEVESRGADIAGAATTIQSLMCIAHGMRRRTGAEGGYRSLVFFDSIDKMRRLHGAYTDAEEGRELASYRITAFGDDAQGSPQTECCREPVGCDRFRDGECWWFAANDSRQCGALGRRVPGSPLRVAKSPIYSGTSSDAEALVKGADIVFATSSLEVGYDDPDIALVYQHYAPQNLASFIQRKGRGGRGLEDRPITAVTLSIYSPRDSWWFRRPHEMLDPGGFDLPLNPDNAFVRRGQALSALLDGIARHAFPAEPRLDPTGEPTRDAVEAGGALVEKLLGPGIWAEFGVADASAFWKSARAARLGGRTRYLGELRRDLSWAPDLLFDTINLPALRVLGPDVSGGDREDVSLAFPTLAPGNATRRYSASDVHWRAPRDGKAPWFAAADYEGAQRLPLAGDEAALLARLPLEARGSLAGLHLDLCRPLTATLDRVGWMAGSFWTAEFGYSPDRIPSIAPVSDGDSPVRHDSRGELRGFLLVSAEAGAARRLPSEDLAPAVASIEAHAGVGLRSGSTGLNVARIFWGADAEVRLDVQGSDPVSFAQIFTGPSSERPLLHGYSVETEGLRIRLDKERLDSFIADVRAEMETDEAERRWRSAQFARYLVESRARGLGLNGYEARRGADLLVAAAGDAGLRARLNRLLKFWSADQFKALLEATRAALLSQHPLMTEARVAKTADALWSEPFRDLIKTCLAEVGDPGAMAAYLRSNVLHALAVRLKIWAAQVGQGDERRLLSHVRLPLQFGEDADDMITLCEAGAHGDGTMRGIIDRWDEAKHLWADGFLSACPNAEEDAFVRAFWRMGERHERWRTGDARDPRALAAVAEELGQTEGQGLPASLVRILFDVETVEAESFALYDVASELEAVRAAAEQACGRPLLDWELASRAVAAASDGSAQVLARLLTAYGDADPEGEGSLAPEARLAEQAFRLGAPLCLDGCRGCVHQPSDLMGDSLTEASVSRRLLQRFLARAAPH